MKEYIHLEASFLHNYLFAGFIFLCELGEKNVGREIFFKID